MEDKRTEEIELERTATEIIEKEDPTKEDPTKEVSAKEEFTEEESVKENSLKDDSMEHNSENEGLGKREKSGKIKLAVLITLIGLLALLAGIYVGVSMYYKTHFLPNTSINGIDCSNMEAEAIVPLIEAQIHQYTLTVTGRDYATGKSGIVLGVIRPDDIALAYEDTQGSVGTVLEEQNEWSWLQAYLGAAQSYSLVQGVIYDEDMLKTHVNDWAACRKENMRAAENAYISDYNETIRGYEIIPETIGTELDLNKTFTGIAEKLLLHEPTLDLEELECYAEAAIKSTDKKLNEAVDTANSWLSTKITYDWNDNEIILDAEILKDWVTMEENAPVLDESAVAAFVKKQAAENDTYGKNRKFKTALGIEITLTNKKYGWKTDVQTETEELLQLIYQGSVAEKEPAYSVTAQNKGANDIGDSYIEADLTHQHLYIVQDGEIVFETDFVSGKMNSTPDCVTPAGVFGLTYKTTNAVLRGADYETPVNYWMPFYGNYGMHDATWRYNFGGTIYQAYGSHGCINLPLDSAATIYQYVFTGSPIVSYYYEVDPLTTVTDTGILTDEELQNQQEPTINNSPEQASE